MQFTSFLLLILAVIAVAGLAFVGLFVISERTTSPNPIPEPTVTETGGPIMSGSLIQGAACEQDSDCVYALNAYPYQRCVSDNCPPESEAQPEQGDPNYQWLDSYHDSCVNANAMQNQNASAEPLLIDTRNASCTCEPIPAGPNGEHTSLTGQKICKTAYVTG